MCTKVVDLEYEMLLLTLELYSCDVVPRNIIQKFIDMLINFSSNTFMSWVENKLTKSYNNDSFDPRGNLRTILSEARKTFKQFDTEYSRFQLYINKGLMIEPVEHILDVKDGKKATYCRVPLSWSFKVLFEISGCFEVIKKYMDDLKHEK